MLPCTHPHAGCPEAVRKPSDELSSKLGGAEPCGSLLHARAGVLLRSPSGAAPCKAQVSFALNRGYVIPCAAALCASSSCASQA